MAVETYSAKWPFKAVSAEKVEVFVHHPVEDMTQAEAGTEIDHRIQRMAYEEGVTPDELPTRYKDFEQRVFVADPDLKRAYTGLDDRHPPKPTTDGPVDPTPKLLEDMAGAVAYVRGVPVTDAIREEVRGYKSVQMAAAATRLATFSAHEQLHPGTVPPSEIIPTPAVPQLKQYATTSVGAGRKPIPASMGLLEWELTAGFQGYSDAVSWAPIAVVIETAPTRRVRDEDSCTRSCRLSTHTPRRGAVTWDCSTARSRVRRC